MEKNKKLENILVTIVNARCSADIRKRDRHRNFIDGRSIYFKILLEFGYSKKNIAESLDMHHATVIHSLNMLNVYIRQDKILKYKYKQCYEDFKLEVDKVYKPSKVINFNPEDIWYNEVVALKINNEALKKEIKSLHSTIKEYGEYAPLLKIIKNRVHKYNVHKFTKKLNTLVNGI